MTDKEIKSPEMNAVYDGPWKEIIKTYFKKFIFFFFPETYKHINWSIPPDFLDKELEKLAPDSNTGQFHVDKLTRKLGYIFDLKNNLL